MNNNILKFTTIAILLFSLNNFSFSQQITDTKIQGRYLIIDDLNVFFTKINNQIICESFQLYNIKEEESSKPPYLAVTELKNVVDFSIESNSSKYENQRRCRLVMLAPNYLETFRLVLNKMEVKYIIYKGDLKSVDDFYLILK
jgi:hypothetical protein